jgi:hypothetical protein
MLDLDELRSAPMCSGFSASLISRIHKTIISSVGAPAKKLVAVQASLKWEMNRLANFLNVQEPLDIFIKHSYSYYYIDKTPMIAELLEQVNKFDIGSICLTRPRRFGKSMMAETIGAFFAKGLDSSEAFSKFKIAGSKVFSQINSRNVFYIDMISVVTGSLSCDDLIIKDKLRHN